MKTLIEGYRGEIEDLKRKLGQKEGSSCSVQKVIRSRGEPNFCFIARTSSSRRWSFDSKWTRAMP